MIRLRERPAGAVPAVVEDVVEVGPDALHDERDLPRAAVDGERVEVDEGRVAAAGREELGLAQRLVGGVRASLGRPGPAWRQRRRRRAERLHGDGLARGVVPRLDDRAEAALAERARRLVVRRGPEPPPLAPACPRAGGVVVAVELDADGGGPLGEHREAGRGGERSMTGRGGVGMPGSKWMRSPVEGVLWYYTYRPNRLPPRP